MVSYVYRDRKMMKWMPFNALLEQGDYISDLLRGRTRQEMPTLSCDQLAEFNYTLEAAFHLHQEVEVTYYQEHDFHKVQGYIMRTDLHNKLIFIGEHAISAYTITNIEVL